MLNVVQLFTSAVPCFNVFTSGAMDFVKNSTQDNHSSLDSVFYLHLSAWMDGWNVIRLLFRVGVDVLQCHVPPVDAKYSQ